MEQQLNPSLQHSEQWYSLRRGKFTSSMCYVFMGAKGVMNDTSRTYIRTKLMELLTGETREVKASSMDHGNEWEPFAKNFIEEKYGSEYFDMEFVQHPIIKYFGGSPDGFMDIAGKKTVIEVKCPVWEGAIKNREFMITPAMCKKSYPQLYWQCVANTDLAVADQALAASFHAKLPTASMLTELFIPLDKEDLKALHDNMAEAYEWFVEQAEIYDIDIEAKYKEFAQPKKAGLPTITEEEAFNHIAA